MRSSWSRRCRPCPCLSSRSTSTAPTAYQHNPGEAGGLADAGHDLAWFQAQLLRRSSTTVQENLPRHPHILLKPISRCDSFSSMTLRGLNWVQIFSMLHKAIAWLGSPSLFIQYLEYNIKVFTFWQYPEYIEDWAEKKNIKSCHIFGIGETLPNCLLLAINCWSCTHCPGIKGTF